MPASLSHETGWRLPLAPREKARPLTKPGNVGPAIMLKWQDHSKGSGKARHHRDIFVHYPVRRVMLYHPQVVIAGR